MLAFHPIRRRCARPAAELLNAAEQWQRVPTSSELGAAPCAHLADLARHRLLHHPLAKSGGIRRTGLCVDVNPISLRELTERRRRFTNVDVIRVMRRSPAEKRLDVLPLVNRPRFREYARSSNTAQGVKRRRFFMSSLSPRRADDTSRRRRPSPFMRCRSEEGLREPVRSVTRDPASSLARSPDEERASGAPATSGF